jgi:hypothetical protein
MENTQTARTEADADLMVLVQYPEAPSAADVAAVASRLCFVQYLVLDSAFHGGGVISRHRALSGAVRSARRTYRQHRSVCSCGRGHIVPKAEAVVYEPGMHYSTPCL